jgi:ribonucleoside-diphosphate reductase alpha chain
MSRQPLPNRREQQLIDFDFEGRRFTVAFGQYSDGRIGEVFLDCDRPDSLSGALARDAAVLTSLAIQHGAAISTIKKALTRNSDGRAAGPLGGALDLLDEGSVS